MEYLDGTHEILAANIIAENMLAQVDDEGHRQLLLSEIVDHRETTDSLQEADAFFLTPSGTKRRKPTTKGWDILLEWKDGSQSWVALKDVKNAFPVEFADYATHNRIADASAFAWWVPLTLKKRKQIISRVKSKYWKRTHNYGILIPKSVEEALQIDAENGNHAYGVTPLLRK